MFGHVGACRRRTACPQPSARPGVPALILGARTFAQLRDNLASLEINLTPAQLQALDESSALDPAYPYAIFTDEVDRGVFGGATVPGLAVATSEAVQAVRQRDTARTWLRERGYAGGVAASRSRTSSGLNVIPAAPRLSRTPSARVLQGMGMMTGDFASSQANTT